MHVHVHGHIHGNVHRHSWRRRIVRGWDRWTEILRVVLRVMVTGSSRRVISCGRTSRMDHRMFQRQKHIRDAFSARVARPWCAFSSGATPAARTLKNYKVHRIQRHRHFEISSSLLFYHWNVVFGTIVSQLLHFVHLYNFLRREMEAFVFFTTPKSIISIEKYIYNLFQNEL